MAGKTATMMELLDTYRTEEDCVRRVYEIRTSGGWTCPKCGAPAPSLLLSRRKV